MVESRRRWAAENAPEHTDVYPLALPGGRRALLALRVRRGRSTLDPAARAASTSGYTALRDVLADDESPLAAFFETALDYLGACDGVFQEFAGGIELSSSS